MSNSSNPRRKAFVMVPPALGHVNPISGLVHELCQPSYNFECIFYGNVEHREKIEATGAQFRLYTHPNIGEILEQRDQLEAENSNMQVLLINRVIDFTYELLPQFIEDFERDRPDLIIYDMAFMPAKCLVKILEVRYRKGFSRMRPPKSLQFNPSFAVNWKMINQYEMGIKKNFSTVIGMFKAACRLSYLSWFYSISNHIWNMVEPHPKLNMIAVFPELQPNLSDFGAEYKFIGPTISEKVRGIVEMKMDQKLRELLLEEKNDNGLKLIYVSMGTVHTNQILIFEKIIESVNELNSVCPCRAVFSVGDKTLSKFEQKTESGEFKCPTNVILCARVPQLEVLKKADVFVTHCGMNSTSEAIKYAVPMVAIPLDADQPMVAKRVCDELGLGVRLDPVSLSVDQLVRTFREVLIDEKFKKNIKELSKISAGYNGLVEGPKTIINYLNLIEVQP